MNQNGILIIGGTGFMGGALARRLSGSGRPVHILARHAGISNSPHVTMHRGSIDDIALLQQILPSCRTIVHAASTTTPGVSAQQPSLEALQNIMPTLRFLETLRSFENRHLIFFSSGGTLYGNPKHVPVTEDHPLAPLSYYGAGKAAIEAFLLAYQSQAGGAVSILRPSNVYGVGQPFRPGFGIIRTMLEHVRKNTALEIWGDGEIIRDFVYIDDTIDACIKLIDSETQSGIYNIGYGRGHTLNQVAQIIETVCNVQLPIKYQPARGIDVKNIVLNPAFLQAATQWKPRITLEEGIALTWAWLNGQPTE